MVGRNCNVHPQQGMMVAATTEAPPCVHRWRIAMPKGPTSEGRCQICGEVREFANAYPFKTYNKAALTLKEQDD